MKPRYQIVFTHFIGGGLQANLKPMNMTAAIQMYF